MTKALLNHDIRFKEDLGNTVNLVERIKNYIHMNDCPDLSMDISHLNILDASKVTVLCSTYHWAKYPDGKINWLINSSDVKELVRPLNLGNISLTTVQ